ncbi:uncharacterized protein [Henckelia pumila]|uniref:uncharacterized protein n=1 Tax=Henckelia pumila TaxID=405737 RepID=UPI003C6E6DA0
MSGGETTETVEWGRLSHLFVTVFLSSFTTFLVLSAIADVNVGAVCGKDECSLALYLTGFQQAISGLGSVVMMPLLGKLSDSYGRKNLLTIPMTLAIIPLVILAWKRTKNWVYAYYAIKTLTAMVSDGGVFCLALGYLADSVADVKRVGVFSVLYGVMYAANIFSTLAARFLSIAHIFQFGAFVSIAALVYMRIFLKNDSSSSTSATAIERPLMSDENVTENPTKVGIPSAKDVFRLLNTSSIFALAACVAFFTSLADSASSNFLTYFWKVKFSFNKDQIAIVFLIQNTAAAISNVFCMPIVGPLVGESTLLCFALLDAFLCMLLNSIAWSTWVPGAAMSLAMFFTIWASSLKSIVSKEVGSSDQGITQGCIMGITSLANTISPLIFSPLTALFLSEKPPFHFPGFSMLCIGFVYLIGLILSVMIKLTPFSFSRATASLAEYTEVATMDGVGKGMVEEDQGNYWAKTDEKSIMKPVKTSDWRRNSYISRRCSLTSCSRNVTRFVNILEETASGDNGHHSQNGVLNNPSQVDDIRAVRMAPSFPRTRAHAIFCMRQLEWEKRANKYFYELEQVRGDNIYLQDDIDLNHFREEALRNQVIESEKEHKKTKEKMEASEMDHKRTKERLEASQDTIVELSDVFSHLTKQVEHEKRMRQQSCAEQVQSRQ